MFDLNMCVLGSEVVLERMLIDERKKIEILFETTA